LADFKDLSLENAYAYATLLQHNSAKQPTRRFIRRTELRRMVPLADTTIYEMEKRGAFPRRIALLPRTVVWDLAEVEAWMEERKRERMSANFGAAKPSTSGKRASRSAPRRK
jgi:prophage regulatory protein